MGNTMEVISSKDLGEGIAFERIRRITGVWLVPNWKD